MKTLLLTGIAGDIAQAVATIVRDVRPDWRLVGVDVHGQHGGSLVVDALDTVPYAHTGEFLPELRRVVREHTADHVLVMSEAELRRLHTERIDEIGGAPIIGSAPAALEIGLDKLSTARFLESIGVPAPWTIEAHPDVLPPLPCLFKPRRSAGSKGVAICRTADECRWHALQTPDGVFQELLLPADAEVTCAVYRDRTGRTQVLPMLRRLVGGQTGWIRVLDAPEAVDQCRTIAERLDLRGPINVQMRLTPAGPRIFEINPRFSSTALLRHRLGFSDVAWLLDELEGRDVSHAHVAPGREAVRTQGAAVLAASRHPSTPVHSDATNRP